MATSESLQLTEIINNKRYYNILKENIQYKLPSVTTILGEMTDKSAIERWRNKIGEAEADRITKFSANRGTCMHQKLEYWFTSNIVDPIKREAHVDSLMQEFIKENNYTPEELKVGNKLFDSLYICGFFNRVVRIIEMENTLFSLINGGYAGRVDCIYENNKGEKVLLDFKTARHKKDQSSLYSYYMQLAAYYLAYYHMHGIKLDKAELWIAVENDAPQLIELKPLELKSWMEHFLKLVKNYHNKFDPVLMNKIQPKTETVKEKEDIINKETDTNSKEIKNTENEQNIQNKDNKAKPTEKPNLNIIETKNKFRLVTRMNKICGPYETYEKIIEE